MTIPPTHADTQMPLRVARACDVAKDIRSFELVQPDGSELPPFTPGSHVKVQAPNGSIRKYSLCNDPGERGRYVITVKRDISGQGGSLSMHEDLNEGDTLPTSLPSNAFPLVESAKSYLFIAGGIGITPILSMIRSFGELAAAPWKLIYLTRSPETTAFLDELGAPELKHRVRIHHSYGDPDRVFDLWPTLEKPNAAHVYCCGPRPLMEAVRDMTGHWSPASVHFESFNEGGGVRPDDQVFTVKLARSGGEFQVPVGKSILAALREHGYNAASSCESGTCGTCRTGLLCGEADHRDMVLMPEEMESQIMVCVSRARSPELVLDL
ncbi:PDR/VanB family oxidoreductase [Variovorax sp. J31P179]|uniref:PDR/VanB family oxidoreductase n=1 Tax=Variovorax sp. J31P179 TaxID=3053508 RepID=UPI0025781378|nr:PDR/VanB family oxidoreductase [Variovorax sp. J31P179]MDM0084603.1 PDR/VanB family oxidoreductase [Variovorax sp. J31P179]